MRENKLMSWAFSRGATRWVALPALMSVVVSTLIVVAVPDPVSALGQTFTVNSIGDGSDVIPGNGVCLTATPGECTLRAAIQEANALPGADVISFNILGSGAHTITIMSVEPGQSGTYQSGLPPITDAVTIDGYTQSGSTANSLAYGDNAARTINIVDGISDVSVVWPMGLVVSGGGDGSVIRGLNVVGWSYSTNVGQAGIAVSLVAPNVVAEGNTMTGEVGLQMFSAGGRVGGANPAQHNSISGGTRAINIQADNSTISGNIFTGSGYFNPMVGVFSSSNVVFGGTLPGAGNTVYTGFTFGEFAFKETGNTGLQILGNRFGVDPTGQVAQGLGPYYGIALGSNGTAFGDGTAGGRNIVSGIYTTLANPYALYIYATGVTVRGNYFGTNADGTVAIPNGVSAIGVAASGVVIGGSAPGDGNLIANSAPGVTVISGTGVSIINNSVYDNVGAGIVLPGAAANDPGDPDTGPNNLQNYPVITPAIVGGNLNIGLSIDSLPGNSAYPITIHIYLADSAASGEGKTLVGSTSVAAPGSTTVSLGNAAALAVFGAEPMVATATDAAGNTSMFSPAVSVAGGNPLSFNLALTNPAASTVQVAPTGIPVSSLDRPAVAAAGGGTSSVAAASISDIGPADTALAAVTIGSTPLKAIVLGSSPLKAIPLLNIGVDGGWQALLAGTDLATQQLDSITFGDALTEPTVASRIAALPLKAIDVNGTPLSAIPLSAIALGSTPLSAIPLKAILLPGEPNPWCAIISSLLQGETCASALTHLSLMEVTLRGVPLSAIPLSAIPLKAIDVNASPLKAIPLSAIDLARSPLKAIPLKAIPLSAIQIAGAPLSAIPLSAIPLKAIPLKAIDLTNSPLKAIPLSAIPLKAITVDSVAVDGTPLKAIPLKAVPLKAIDLGTSPLKAIPLKAIPLKAIPLSAIELYASPLKAIPLSAIDIAGTPLSAIPLKAIDLVGSPLKAIPLKAIPLSAIPLKAIPLSAIAIGATPLSAIPLKAIKLLDSPLKAIPLKAIPLSAINCGLVDCSVGTLGDAFAAGAVLDSATLSSIQSALSGIRLGELAPYFTTFGSTELTAAIAGTTLTIGDLTSVDDLTLGDLPKGLAALSQVTLAALGNALTAVTYADLVGAAVNPATGLPVTAADLLASLDGSGTTVGDLSQPGNLTAGDLIDAVTGPITLDTISPLLGFITVDAFQQLTHADVSTYLTRTLGAVPPADLGTLTLLDLAARLGTGTVGELLAGLGLQPGVLDGFTLGDLLLAILDPGSLALGGDVAFQHVDVAALPLGTVPATPFSATFKMNGSSAQQVAVDIALPSTASYTPGSSTLTANGLPAGSIEPTVSGRTLSWTFTAQPGTNYAVDFGVLPTLRLGSTTLSGTARIVGTDFVVPASAGVTVAEGTEPNDFALGAGGSRQTTIASPNTVYLTYISTPTDIDVYQLTVQQNDQLDVDLSNLGADLDVAVWGRPSGTTVGTALAPTSGDAPLVALTDPDSASVNAQPLNDFPRLDALDPTLKLITTSNHTGTTGESIKTDRLPAGTYFVEVYGANGVTTVEPASLQMKVLAADAAPACSARNTLASGGTLPTAPTIPGSANTLILTNSSRTQSLFGAQGRTDVLAATGRLTTYLAAHPELGVTPVVVPVDAYPAIRAAYATWDAGCDPTGANAVVNAINTSIINPNRSQFKNIVILGGDDVIPMARLADNTVQANEYDFRHEFDGSLAGANPNGMNALTSTFWNSTFLSDEPYGDAAARSLGDRYLYVTDVALGRVVETPADIVKALDTFAQFNGTLQVGTAKVLGYDFLADGSAQVAANIAANGVPVDSDLADGTVGPSTGPKWTSADALAKLQAAGHHALVSLNAHFDHYRSLPAAGDKVPGYSDNLIADAAATALGPNALTQSMVFSMGCHGGLSVSDILIGNTNADWAQTLGREGSLFVGNTGFGYGDTKSVAYTEQLMALFAAQVTAPFDLDPSAAVASSTVGQALAWAKNQYVAGLQSFSVYDEKAVMESTFYGLPFYRVGLAPGQLPAAPTTQPVADSTGTAASPVSVTAANTPNTSSAGTYYANTDASGNQQIIVAPGRPIQPETVRDISVVTPTDTTHLSQVAHGAIVLGMDSTFVSLPDPVIATPIFDQSSGQPEPPVGDVAFPTKPLEITTTTGPAGQRQQLVVATGQYQSDSAVQRLDGRIDTVVYYSAPGQTDATAPTIGVVDSAIVNGRLSLSATVSDAGTGVDRVYVLVVQNPGLGSRTWTGVDLVRDGTTNHWTGSMPLSTGTTDVEFMVQAKDDAGNVGLATNKAQNFNSDQQPTSVVPIPPADVLTAQAATAPNAAGFYRTLSVTINVASASPATYAVDGTDRGAIPTGGSFAITGEGLHRWVVTTSSGWAQSGSVLIDTIAPHVVGIPSTAPNAAHWNNGPLLINWSVDDPTATTPAATAITNEGANLAVTSPTSCDPAGNCATGSYTAKIDLTAPDIAVSTSVGSNAFGWNKTAVTVSVACADTLSGVTSCPAPVVLSAEGANLAQSFSVADVAGNVTSASSRPINIDLTKPTVTLISPANGSTVAQSAYVTPTCTAADVLSGLDGTCSVTIGDPITVVGGYTVTASASAADKAGNTTTTASVTFTVRTDAAGPVINPTATPLPNGAGWWKGTVVYSFVCTDSSGVGICPASKTISTEGANQTFTVSSSDVFGNSSQLSISAVNIDKTLPTVTVVAPTSVGPLDTVTITCSASDALSGVATASCANRTFPASQLQSGANVFTFTATDVAGNTTTVTKTITLVIPVNPAPTVLADMGVAGLNDIGFQTNIIVLTGTYSDPSGPGPYTASVRWKAGAAFTPFILSANGEFVAAYIYPAAGTYVVTVKICDAGGACGTDDVTVRSAVAQKISPVRECVTNRGASVNPRYVAKWGYNNPATFAIAVPSIPILENTFTDSPYLRGQPQIFLPGQQRGVFTNTFQSGTPTWRINGNTASAATNSPAC